MQNSYLIPNAPRIDLMNLLDELSAKRLIYVCAPAGYGKSFSIRMWQSRRGFPGAWLAVNESAGSKPNEFCERFIGSLLALQPTNADLKENMLHKSFSAAPFEFIGQAMNSFRLEALQNPEQKYTLVIDDVHLISSRDIFKFMPALIDGLPECVMICILSRTEPHECFSKFVVKQELAIVDARQLKFSENEIKLFFESCGQKLTFRQISDVIAATDGWAIGLNAILLSGHQKAGRKQLSRYLDTFIKEEVWERWDDDRREFILRVSVVDELTPDFCRAMTGRGDSKKVLEELVRENAFISVGNENIYRFHHLFQDFLKTVLSAESEKRKNRFYQNAGDWFFKLGDYYRAVEFYIKCGSNSGITKGLKLMYDYNSPYAAVEDTLSIIRLSVDRSIADEYPFLLEVLSWAAYVEGRAEELQNLLDRYYKLFPKIVLQNPRSLITRVVVDCMDPRISMVDISKGLRKLPFKRGAKATTPSVTQSLPLFHRSGREFSTEYAFDTEENLKLLGKTVGLLMNDEYPIIEDLIRGGLLYERGNLDEAHEYAISAIVKIQENFAPEFKFSAYMLLAAILEAQNHRADAIKTLDSAKAMIEKHKAY
ncbi:MAG: hypothetical protein LBI27_00140, partial [Clostridiales bacterium]|nr:hypothetical protein [Clostridiales bacterium]